MWTKTDKDREEPHQQRFFFLRSWPFRWDIKCEGVFVLACLSAGKTHANKTEHKIPVFPFIVCFFTFFLSFFTYFLTFFLSFFLLLASFLVPPLFLLFGTHKSSCRQQVEGLKGFSLVTTGLGDPEWFICATVYLLMYFWYISESTTLDFTLISTENDQHWALSCANT